MPQPTPTAWPSRRELRDAVISETGDPLLSFAYIESDLGISHNSFHRGPRREMPVVQVSSRRYGIKRSVYEAWKVSRTIAAVRPA